MFHYDEGRVLEYSQVPKRKHQHQAQFKLILSPKIWGKYVSSIPILECVFAAKNPPVTLYEVMPWSVLRGDAW